MTDQFAINDEQFRKIIATIDTLYDHTPYWKHFFTAAAPIFLASLLGLGTALFLDWLKTRRENRKLTRERQENELAKLSGVMTALGFNVDSLLLVAMEQILPHHKESHAAIAAMSAVRNNTMDVQQFDRLLHSKFRPMMERCPEPYFIDVELFKEVPFILANDPDLIKQSGWILSFTRHLKLILSERNKAIDLATIGKEALELDFNTTERQAEIQAAISNAEIVNCFQLFENIMAVCKKLENIIRQNYKDVLGPKLRVQPPEILHVVLKELERASKAIVPDWPAREPPAV